MNKSLLTPEQQTKEIAKIALELSYLLKKPSDWLHILIRLGIITNSWMDTLFIKMNDFFSDGEKVKAEYFINGVER